VVFGKVVQGFDDVVRTVESTPTGPSDRPAQPVMVKRCGFVPLKNGPYEIRA